MDIIQHQCACDAHISTVKTANSGCMHCSNLTQKHCIKLSLQLNHQKLGFSFKVAAVIKIKVKTVYSLYHDIICLDEHLDLLHVGS